ncbi:osmotic stress-responsive proline [Lasius niger]|uniref:Osmotic stress-responsive proline n=1 Tax=Lasius niger TaxID=67767 RepID=A0A0J7K8Y0_LASNI|nr:osmotic stress-responsive proline [Lasius niger]
MESSVGHGIKRYDVAKESFVFSTLEDEKGEKLDEMFERFGYHDRLKIQRVVYEARRFRRKCNKDAKAAIYQVSLAMGLIAETASREEAKGEDTT